MVSDVNYVKCPKCGHDRNSSTASNCEICGQPLKNKGVPPIAWLALVALLLIAGGGYLFWKNNADPQSTVATAPSEVPPAADPNGTPQASSNGALDQVKSPNVKLYNTLAEVENVPSGLFNYGGSTTFAPLRSKSVLAAIEGAHPNFRLRYTEPAGGKPGSGSGISGLTAGELSLAQSSRPLKDAEFKAAQARGISLEQVPVAIDGIAFYVNPTLKVPGLSIDQVADIFTGRVTNWKQVGGPSLPIVPLSRDLKAGGTVDFINEAVLEGKGFGPGVRTVRDTTESLRKVATTPGGIGYATASEVIGQQTIRSLPLARAGTRNYLAPFTENNAVNEAAFRDGTYPVTRRLFVVIRRDGKLDEQAGAAYANLLLSSEGQKLVEKAGFVPIR